MPKLPARPAEIVDHLLLRDPSLRRLSEEIHRQEVRLRSAGGASCFRVYLVLEDIANERLLALVERVWAIACSRSRRQVRARR
jgi:hypothetical protein